MAEGIVSREQSMKLWAFFEKRRPGRGLDSPHVLYYLGGLTVLATLSYLLVDQWQKKQTSVLFLTLSLMTLFFCLSAHYLQNAKKIAVPAGLCAVLASISFYGSLTFLLTLLGWDAPLPAGIGPLKSEFILLRNASLPGIGGLGLAVFMSRRIRFPFQIFVVFCFLESLWKDAISFTLRYGGWAPMQAQCPTCPPYDMLAKAGVFFGLICLYVADRMERNNRKAEALWVHLLANMTILSSFNSATYAFTQHHWLAALSFAFYMGLLVLSVIGRRTVLSVTALLGIGDFIYFLLGSFFKNSILFPYLLIAAGTGIIYMGVYYKRNQEKIEVFIRKITGQGGLHAS